MSRLALRLLFRLSLLAPVAADCRQYAARARSPLCRTALVLGGLAAGTLAHAQPTPEAVAERGELLYSNHCVECHTTQMHWRTQRQASDWDSLKAQVRRWQGVVSLGWSEADINDVARYLNDTIYQFPRQVSGAGRALGGLADAVPSVEP